MTETAEAIRAAEQRRCDAMLANDPAALDAALHPRLQFHHASGAVDDKAAYIAKMSAGRIVYAGIAWEEQRIEELAADVALLTGKMITDVRVEGVDKRLNNRVMTLWRFDEDLWRLLAFQSTPIAA